MKVKNVRLNGEVVDYCRSFDTDAGWVEVFVVSDSGQFITEQGSAVTKTLHGEVTVDWRDSL